MILTTCGQYSKHARMKTFSSLSLSLLIIYLQVFSINLNANEQTPIPHHVINTMEKANLRPKENPLTYEFNTSTPQIPKDFATPCSNADEILRLISYSLANRVSDEKTHFPTLLEELHKSLFQEEVLISSYSLFCLMELLTYESTKNFYPYIISAFSLLMQKKDLKIQSNEPCLANHYIYLLKIIIYNKSGKPFLKIMPWILKKINWNKTIAGQNFIKIFESLLLTESNNSHYLYKFFKNFDIQTINTILGFDPKSTIDHLVFFLLYEFDNKDFHLSESINIFQAYSQKMAYDITQSINPEIQKAYIYYFRFMPWEILSQMELTVPLEKRMDFMRVIISYLGSGNLDTYQKFWIDILQNKGLLAISGEELFSIIMDSSNRFFRDLPNITNRLHQFNIRPCAPFVSTIQANKVFDWITFKMSELKYWLEIGVNWSTSVQLEDNVHQNILHYLIDKKLHLFEPETFNLLPKEIDEQTTKFLYNDKNFFFFRFNPAIYRNLKKLCVHYNLPCPSLKEKIKGPITLESLKLSEYIDIKKMVRKLKKENLGFDQWNGKFLLQFLANKNFQLAVDQISDFSQPLTLTQDILPIYFVCALISSGRDIEEWFDPKEENNFNKKFHFLPKLTYKDWNEVFTLEQINFMEDLFFTRALNGSNIIFVIKNLDIEKEKDKEEKCLRTLQALAGLVDLSNAPISIRSLHGIEKMGVLTGGIVHGNENFLKYVKEYHWKNAELDFLYGLKATAKKRNKIIGNPIRKRLFTLYLCLKSLRIYPTRDVRKYIHDIAIGLELADLPSMAKGNLPPNYAQKLLEESKFIGKLEGFTPILKSFLHLPQYKTF